MAVRWREPKPEGESGEGGSAAGPPPEDQRGGLGDGGPVRRTQIKVRHARMMRLRSARGATARPTD